MGFELLLRWEFMKVVYQLWQVWEDNGNEFLMGTYLTRPRAKFEQEELEKEASGNYQYIIRPEEVKE